MYSCFIKMKPGNPVMTKGIGVPGLSDAPVITVFCQSENRSCIKNIEDQVLAIPEHNANYNKENKKHENKQSENQPTILLKGVAILSAKHFVLFKSERAFHIKFHGGPPTSYRFLRTSGG